VRLGYIASQTKKTAPHIDGAVQLLQGLTLALFRSEEVQVQSLTAISIAKCRVVP